jgi:CubicO group peptidase (beta-lactamase class C family)
MLAQDMRQWVWMLGIFVTGLVLLLGVACSGGDGSKEDSAAGPDSTGGGEQASTADLDAALKKSFKQNAAPGVVAAVQTPEYTWIRALGVADRTSEEPMTPEVHHRIGSVTKTFTITLLLQAEARGSSRSTTRSTTTLRVSPTGMRSRSGRWPT